MKKILTSLVCVALFVQACGGTPKPTALQNYESEFASLPIPTEETIDPIELVEMPARQENPDPNAFTLRLSEGVVAPFSGLLLSNSAAAFIVSEYQAQAERFVLALQHQRQKAIARLLLDNQRLTLQINGERERFLVAVRSQQQQIIDLRQLNEEANSVWPKVWIGVGAFSVGALIGIIIGLVATK